jgi:two-component system cell cycle response regulator
MKILVADDNVVSRRPLEAALQRWGHEVITASSGSEAWRILQEDDTPRIAILDWMMPGLSGPEVCRMVRQLEREYYTYIIMLTSRSEREDFINGMQSGADDYLIKPPDFGELQVRLGPALRIVKLETEVLRMKEELRIQATRDSLTGIWNRNAAFEILERELVRSSREDRPLAIGLADLDHFKTVNDSHGHIAGDSVLRNTAERMLHAIRPYDSLGRYGGEEFLVILPGCELDVACRKAEALRRAVEDGPILSGENPVRITASFGVTSIPGRMPVRSERIIDRADEALYRAKRDGRNRVVCLPFED